MDGTLAVIFLVASLTDMGMNDCPTGCIASEQAVQRLSFQAAKVAFQDSLIGNEYYLGYDLGTAYGPFQPTIGASVTDSGDYWIGAGAKWTTQGFYPSPFFVESTFMPGYFEKDRGPDLGGHLQFRSSLGAGFTFENGATILASYDHRSNADRIKPNPGLETIALRIAFPF